MRYNEIKEASLSGKTDVKYLDTVNDLVSQRKTFYIGKNGDQGEFVPDSGQKFADRTTPIKGTINGEPAQVRFVDIYKSADIKAAATGKAASEKIANKGEIVEGIYGAATMARLIKRPNESITPDDVYAIINELPNMPQGGSVKKSANEVTSDISDNFELIVKLKPQPYADLKNTAKIKAMMGGIVKSVVNFVNNETIPRYAKLFSENGRPDTVSVVSDGISDETGTKTDVRLIYTDAEGKVHRDLVKYGQSVKVGSVKQFGQVGGGAASDSLETRFSKLELLWDKFGIDIGDLKTRFTQSNRIEDAYEYVYDQAAARLKDELAGSNENKESEFLKKMVQGIKFFATLNDDNVNLIQFTEKGYYVLDFKKLDRLFKQGLDLDVIVQKGKVKGSDINLPKVTIIDKNTGTPFLSIRMYRAGTGYIRNYIEKEKGMVAMTKVRGK